MDRARHIAVAFQVTQLARQHAVRDVSDEPLYFVEPFRAVLKHGEDQKTPLVPDLIEHVAKRTVLRVLIALDRYLEHFRNPISRRMLTCRSVIITEDDASGRRRPAMRDASRAADGARVARQLERLATCQCHVPTLSMEFV